MISVSLYFGIGLNEIDASFRHAEGIGEMIEKARQEGSHIDAFKPLILVQGLVDDRQRINPVTRRRDGFLGLRVLQLTPLKVQEARHNLEIVLHGRDGRYPAP